MEAAIGRFMDVVDDDPDLTFRDIGRRLMSMEHGEESKPKSSRRSTQPGPHTTPPRRKLTTWDENSIQFFNDVKALQRIIIEEVRASCVWARA